MTIRDPAAADEAGWRRLWAGYLAFYGETLPEAVTAATWARMLDPASPVFARLAERDGSLVGMTVNVLHEGTWSTTPVCYLEDLFVAPEARGGGIGQALIADLVERGKARGWSRLYWHTRAGNAQARRLYERFVAADHFCRYRLVL
ncbi:UNVERIFIED_ORG: GNAT superfamily N-acetyltransferase [Methylobacterium sp. SuP10 SLI 274]|uniref:GNAT family N-acetyltransferase n=1 Tax=Methylorubrum extorquens TaxID=408 RepID=UPI0020A1AD1E|nr:GNAT family N-acetyltransferase [Methylorubrum extorquens]MDF9864860.1 GNAT superfamily N-acetyltransferase [Methylorubrum pseudosasae]MDH6638436.1 GNAT superfamily N-acetyltransferase [Methylobacterium sp. SuP10 SLI 274]MDH6667619.1 GNAT superfamily N-acetyltransferase [Methylorubrum zatmanii]MCP1559517.1 GNAT superfamily N-acetyltransferase [Methylorubrum extorquens]MDF9793159.1 GNAT superfamily N-acetyltransferase [Methylorubrum extorquens]